MSDVTQSVANKTILLSVVIVNVNLLSVIVPLYADDQGTNVLTFFCQRINSQKNML
jgi:hypothetical protein